MGSPFQGGYTNRSFPTNADEGQIQLTAEELRVLKQCNSEGIQRRGIPVGLTFGVISHLLAKQKGIMNHQKFGSLPVVLTSAFVGFIAGRLSYFPVCYERLMEVPDGIVRQRAMYGVLPGGMAPQVGQVPPQEGPKMDIQRRTTDIDTPTMSNFDIMPSNLDSDTPQLPADPIEAPRQYRTYEELRERNRREYMDKMSKSPYSQMQPSYPPSPGYPIAQPEYPPSQPGFPPPQPGYPPSQPGYPPSQPGYPPPQPGYEGGPVVPPRYPAESQIPAGQPTYQRRPRVPAQSGDPNMMTTQDPTSGPIHRKIKTKYGDEWE